MTGVAGERERRERLGAFVRRARLDAGMTGRALANAAHLSHPVITAIEAGRKYKVVSLEVVALALGWPPGAAQAYLNGDDDALPSGVRSTQPSEREEARAARASATRERLVRASHDDLMETLELIQEGLGPESAEAWLRNVLKMREDAARLATNNPARPREAG